MSIIEVNNASVNTSQVRAPNIAKLVSAENVVDVPKQDHVRKASTPHLSTEDVENMVDSLYEFTNMLQTKLKFSILDDTNEIVVKVINRQTDEIIRQIPPEELLEIHANMKKMSGLLFYQNV
jgi:flagellar protein FlaG